MPFTTELVGASSGAQFTGSDYTDPAVTQPFMNFFSDLFRVANSTIDPTENQASNLQKDLIKLLNIAKNGISVQNEESGKSVTYYMTAQMTDSLNAALKSLQAGGVSDLPNITQTQLAAWQTSVQSGTLATDLSFNKSLFNLFYYVANYFSNSKVSLNTTTTAAELIAALSKNTNGDVELSPYAARSLQAMTEVDYVNEGNQLINDTLTEMYEALGLTKEVIDNLTTLQDIHNGLKVVNRQDNFVYSRNDLVGTVGNATNFQDFYERSTSTLTNNLIPQLTEEYSPWLFPGVEINIDMSSIVGNPGGAGADVSRVTITATLPTLPFDPNTDRPYLTINPVTQQIYPLPPDSFTVGGSVLLPFPASQIVDTPEFKAKVASLLAYQKPIGFVPSADTETFAGLTQLGDLWPLITTASLGREVTTKLSTARTAFAAQVDALRAAAGTDTNSQTYKDIIDNPQSLYNLSKKVLEDMGNITNYSNARSWIIDNYQAFNTTDATKAGAYQQAITAAVTAAQATNDEQKETVRNNLFLFEEFYKSASTVLTQLNQIIVKMGQNISR